MPTGATNDLLCVIFESKRIGGGAIDHIKFNCGDTRALIKFEDLADR